MTVGAWLTGTLMWNCCGPLKRLKSQAFTNRSSGSCPAVKVVCASCAAFTAKVMLAAWTTPLTVKWPLARSALLSQKKYSRTSPSPSVAENRSEALKTCPRAADWSNAVTTGAMFRCTFRLTLAGALFSVPSLAT